MKTLLGILICILSINFIQAQKDTSRNPIILNEPIGYLKNDSYQIANSLLWRISGNGLSKPSYIFGTIHIGDKEVYQVPDSLIYFIKNCDGFANELSPKELMRYIASLSDNSEMVPSLENIVAMESATIKPSTLKAKKKDKYEEMGELFNSLNIGGKNKKYAEILKPFNIMDSEEKYRETILDGYLLKIALQLNKKMGSLELAEAQATILGNGIIDVEAETAASKNISIGFMKSTYLLGNIDAIYDIYNINKVANTENFNLNSRNVYMVKSIDSLSKKGSWVYAMGALHLSGSVGVINLLKEKGYTIEPVLNTKKKDITLVNDVKYQYTLSKFYSKDSSYNIIMPINTIDKNKDNNNPSSFVHFSFDNATYYRSQKVNGVGHLLNNDFFRKEFVNVFCAKPEYTTITWNTTNTDNVIIKSQYKNIKKEFRLRKLGEDLVINSIATNYYTKNKDKEHEAFFNSYTPNNSKIPKTISINEAKTKIFYDSLLQLKYPIPVDATYSFYTNENDAEIDDNYIVKISTTKFINNTITITSYEALNGEYLYQDTALTESLIENSKTDSTIVMYEKDTIINNQKIHKLITLVKKNDLSLFNYKYIFNYNCKVYTLKLQSIDSIIGFKWLANFEKDFGFITLPTTEYKSYTIKNNIKVYLPQMPNIVAPKENTTSSFIRTSRDKANGSIFIITDEKENEFAFYNNYIEAFTYYNKKALGKEDTLIDIIYDSTSIYPNTTYTIKNKKGTNICKQRTYFYGENILHFTFAGAQENLNTKQINAFFDSIKILRTPEDKNFYFTNKTSKILDALQNSKDSITLSDAFNEADQDKFTKTDIPNLKAILQRDFSKTTFDNSDLQSFLLRSLFKLDSVACINYVKSKWDSLNTDLQKNIYLEILLKVKTISGYDGIIKLMEKNGLQYFSTYNRKLLEDSIALKKYFVANLLQSKNYDNFCGLSIIVSEMLDSGIISISNIKAVMPSFEMALKTHTQNYKKDPDYEMQNIYYLMHLIDTSGYKASTDLMQQIAYLKTEEYKFTKIQACIFLLQQNIEPTITIQKLAKDLEWRRTLYNEFYNKKLDKYFPAAFKTPEKMAESILYNYLYDNDYQNGGIKYKGILVLQIDGNKDTAYCFTVLNEESEESKLYAVVGKQAILKAGSTNIVDAKEYYNKEALTSFKKEFEGYLKKTEESENESEKK